MLPTEFARRWSLLPAFARQCCTAEALAEVAGLYEECESDLLEEIVFLHRVGQGVTHYPGCAKNAANTGVLIEECPRCEAERLRGEEEVTA